MSDPPTDRERTERLARFMGHGKVYWPGSRVGFGNDQFRFDPLNDANDAVAVAERWHAKDPRWNGWEVNLAEDGWLARCFTPDGFHENEADTLPRAICEAALAALES